VITLYLCKYCVKYVECGFSENALYLYKRESCCVSHVLYTVHTQCQVWGLNWGISLFSPMKTYKGHVCTASIAWHGMAPERMHSMNMGMGLTHVEAQLDVMQVAFEMGLGCCGGVHPTSRPPQKNISFPQLPLIDGLELCN
jgi:hypothetical protein